METCIFCQKPVLGIVGNDELLNSNYVSKNDSDILANEVFGECHSNCLIDAGWSERWANLRVNSLSTIRGYELTELPDEQVCINSSGTSAFVVSKKSWKCIAINSSMLVLDTTIVDGFLIEHEVNWLLEGHAGRFDLQHWTVPTGVPLRNVADKFCVQELYQDIDLSKGTFRSKEEQEENFGLGYLSGVVRYPLELPNSVCDLIRRTLLLHA